MIPIQAFSGRRHRLASQMQKGVAIIPTAPERVRNRDAHYPYRFDSYFYYLTGFAEPEAVLVIVAGVDKDVSKSILFSREKNIEYEIWNGFRYGPEAAREAFEFDETYPIAKLDEMLPRLLADQPAVFCALGDDTAWDARVIGWVNQVRQQSRSGTTAPAEIRDIRLLLDEMRLFKGPEELQVMRRAAEISGGAHRRAMQNTRPGMSEYEVEAELMHEFRRHGAQAPAYTSIVAGGANACVLHYVDNNARLKAGELLLIDAGCELDGYAADITRTFPVNGKFNPAQRDLYELVLSAQAAAINAVRPGNTWDAPHNAALQVLAQGFIDLGLCHGSVDEVIQSEDYKRFYMHRTGHWLGLDVHDVGEYKRNGEWRPLQPGMTLTVEPGCYVRPADNVPKHFWNIGIRIEDDVAVTETGCEVLTGAAPKTVAEIEELMRDRKKSKSWTKTIG
ncbi:aminopeptidase P Metallo peptidase. MEROPS family M24B [Nitrosospira sp. Nsp18]|uniref:Xaa-Pro aminopeptidase n=1 Tax=Nitrosospira sp. Nsp18 TaxID=1855334 RepID=UPI000886FD89|nr:Xaa-Pro aminopeptidase [Nitrosospira sp. Nsp18]SDA14802.1 aminopeptidase P Metallo peptidase. MEROPS family M24B [Nitrosospira sp. Nsp18]